MNVFNFSIPFLINCQVLQSACLEHAVEQIDADDGR